MAKEMPKRLQKDLAKLFSEDGFYTAPPKPKDLWKEWKARMHASGPTLWQTRCGHSFGGPHGARGARQLAKFLLAYADWVDYWTLKLGIDNTDMYDKGWKAPKGILEKFDRDCRKAYAALTVKRK